MQDENTYSIKTNPKTTEVSKMQGRSTFPHLTFSCLISLLSVLVRISLQYLLYEPVNKYPSFRVPL